MNKLEDLIKEELLRANKKHNSLFHSLHEFWAVILEEVQEAGKDMNKVNYLSNDLWEYVKTDNYNKCHEVTNEISKMAANCIHELIQVIAMTKKMKLSFEPPEKIEVDKEY
jgi:hypothetical protein